MVWGCDEITMDGEFICTRKNPCNPKNRQRCKRCESVRTHRQARKIAVIMEGKRCALVTLTQRQWDENVKDQLKRQSKRLFDVRRGELWKRSVIGGYVFFHFGNKQMDSINTHIHAIVEVRDDVDLKLLGDELEMNWGKHGGGNVDVREISDGMQSRSRVAHYCTKGIIRQFGGKANEFCEEVWKGVYGKQKSFPIGKWRGGGRLESVSLVEGGKKRGRKPKVVEVDQQLKTEKTETPKLSPSVIDSRIVQIQDAKGLKTGIGQGGQTGQNCTISECITQERSELDARSTIATRQTDLTNPIPAKTQRIIKQAESSGLRYDPKKHRFSYKQHVADFVSVHLQSMYRNNR